jgi:3-oxoacyl-[acyl-carrier protein] reductase
MDSLNGRRALVTGASRNLGAEIARHLAAEGASVAVNYRSSEDEANRVVDSLESGADTSHAAVRGDVNRPSEISYLVDTASTELGGPIDVLINNAGPYLSTPFVELDVDEFDTVWNTNARAIYLLTQAVAPGMQAAGFGRIVNVSASSAYVRNRSIYTLANASVITLTEQLALELSPEVLVNAVAPGQIHESLDELREHVPDWADEVVRRTPIGRLATRPEIARIVTLMCGPTFDAVTGVTVPIDGGLRLRTI